MRIKRHFEVVSRLLLTRPRGWKSVLFNTAMLRAKRVGPLLAPAHVTVEPTNACNARCPVCETGKNDMHRPTGFLDRAVYNEFIDEIAPTTNTLMFYFMGEPFMHVHAYDMIRYARDKGIYVETCSNGDFVDAKGIIYSDVNKISIQIGGLDEDTHQRYRVRSSFAKAERNLRAMVSERRKYPNSNVQIEVGFIVMRHNEHQVDQFKAWAKDVGVDVANVIDPCARNMMEAMAYLPKDRKYWFYDEDAFERGVLKPKVVLDNDCTWIWNSTQLTWNGDVVPCCRDPNGKHVFGNAFEHGLLSVFNGEKARDFRHRILTAQGDIDICRLCSGYGVPHLDQPRVAAFTVEHHSISYPGAQAAE